MSFNWNDNIGQRVLSAVAGGMDETMSECVRNAKDNYYEGHGLITTTLQGSIQLRPAERRGNAIVGQWGSFDVNYAIFVEKGTARAPGQGQLQNAADLHYPKLVQRIKARL